MQKEAFAQMLDLSRKIFSSPPLVALKFGVALKGGREAFHPFHPFRAIAHVSIVHLPDWKRIEAETRMITKEVDE